MPLNKENARNLNILDEDLLLISFSLLFYNSKLEPFFFLLKHRLEIKNKILMNNLIFLSLLSKSRRNVELKMLNCVIW